MKSITCYVPQGIDLLFARLARAPEAEVAEQAPGVDVSRGGGRCINFFLAVRHEKMGELYHEKLGLYQWKVGFLPWKVGFLPMKTLGFCYKNWWFMLYQHLEIEAHLNPWGFNHEEFVFFCTTSGGLLGSLKIVVEQMETWVNIRGILVLLVIYMD